MKKFLIIIIILLVGVGFYHSKLKNLPEGLSVAGKEYLVSDSSIIFLADETFINSVGEREIKQEIFEEALKMIDSAQKYILVDMFLFNDFQGKEPENHRKLSGEFIEALILKKQENPNIIITLVTDPINTVYGGQESIQLNKLEAAGIQVVMTDLRKLRDSNPIYSSFWRTFIQWFGNNTANGFIPHIFQYEGQKITLRSYLSLLNFKANHRKIIVADNGNNKVRTLVTSMNFHDDSSAHGNSAIIVDDMIWRDAILSEQVVGKFSDNLIPDYPSKISDPVDGSATVQLLTEEKIRDSLIRLISNSKKDDKIDLAVFYFSDRKAIKALKKADSRGVIIRIILDPNKDAFGREKNGVPNRQVAHELLKNSIGNTELRWCHTNGEQCHSKMVIFKTKDYSALLLGSANFTRRNLGDLNLETNVLVKSSSEIEAISDAQKYFNRMWNNEMDRKYTVDYEKYKDESFSKKILYRIMERTGMSTF